MADIEFNCPKCNGHLVVEEVGAGKQVKCPDCSEEFIIPTKMNELANSIATCPYCGKSIAQNVVICVNCGMDFRTGKKIEIQYASTATTLRDSESPQENLHSLSKPCFFCGKPIHSSETMCKHCEEIRNSAIKKSRNREPQNIPAQPPSFNMNRVLWVSVLVVAFILSFHIITGGDVGFKIVRRNGFGISEFIINVDAITGTPWFMATSKYPIGCKVLQRENIIESDEVRAYRVSALVDQKMEESMKKAEKLMKDAMNRY